MFCHMASIAPVCSPTAIICVTMPGKTVDSFKGSVSDLPSSRDLRTWNSAFSTTALPDVLAVISNPSRIGTPEEIKVPSVRVNRSWKESEEHTSELQSPDHLVCRLLLEKKKKIKKSD